MAPKSKTLFYCTECGNEMPKWQGQCPACGAWNTVVEQPAETRKKAAVAASKGGGGLRVPRNRPRELREVEASRELRFEKYQEERQRDMKAILAADKNWGIGYNNHLLVSIPSDMKFFRQTTTGKVVVMGRKTLESFPNGMPLKNRINIVLTGNQNYQVKDAVVVHSEDELLDELKKYDTDDIYVIGGESVYRMMLPYCDTVYVTKIDRAFQADTFFPDLDEMDEWEMTEESEEQTCFDLEFCFTKYERR